MFLDQVWIQQKEICTVQFVSEEGVTSNYVSVIKGESLKKLPGLEPGTQDGDRIFDGWYTEDGVLLDKESPIVTDIMVYARSHDASETD